MVLTPTDSNGRQITFQPKEEYALFTRAQWMVWGELLSDYRTLHFVATKLQEAQHKCESAVSNLQDQKELYERQLDAQNNYSEQLNKLLDSERNARKAALKSRQKAALWTSVIAGGAIIIAGIFGGMYAAERLH